jgi:hypothetical protein
LLLLTGPQLLMIFARPHTGPESGFDRPLRFHHRADDSVLQKLAYAFATLLSQALPRMILTGLVEPPVFLALTGMATLRSRTRITWQDGVKG